MASSYYGNGYAPLMGSSLIREKPQKDPNWELNQNSEEQTSVFTEQISTRILTAVGFLQPKTLNIVGIKAGQGVGAPVLWTTLKGIPEDNRSLTELTFYFGDLDIQRCYGIQIESAAFIGLPSDTVVIPKNARSELCADSIDDVLVNRAVFMNFSALRGGVLEFRESNNPTQTKTMTLFSPSGLDDGYYSGAELFELVKQRVKEKLEIHYGGLDVVHVEFYIDPTYNRYVLAWELGPAIKAQIQSIQLNMDPRTSTIFKLLEIYLQKDRFYLGVFTHDTVTAGDGLTFLRSSRTYGSMGSDNFNGSSVLDRAANVHPMMTLISPELTQFEKDDSITPVSGIGEICTMFPVDDNGKFWANDKYGSLTAPKLPFDPNFSLTEFTVKVVFPTRSELFDYFLNGVYNKFSDISTIDGELLKQRINLVLVARLY